MAVGKKSLRVMSETEHHTTQDSSNAPMNEPGVKLVCSGDLYGVNEMQESTSGASRLRDDRRSLQRSAAR